MHPFLSLVLNTNIAKNLSIFRLMLFSLLYFLYFAASIHFTFIFFSPHQTDSSIQSFFFCSPFSNISFYFSVGLFSSQEIPGRKIVEECFLCLARGESPHSGPSLKEMGLNSWGAYADDTCPAFLRLLHYTLFPRKPWCYDLSCTFLHIFYNTFSVSLHNNMYNATPSDCPPTWLLIFSSIWGVRAFSTLELPPLVLYLVVRMYRAGSWQDNYPIQAWMNPQMDYSIWAYIL